MDSPAGRVAALQNEAKALELFDLSSHALIGSESLPAHARDLAVDPGLALAVVSHSKTDTLSLVDLNGPALSSTLAVGADPNGVAVDSSRHLAVVANTHDGTVSLVDLKDPAVMKTLAVGQKPKHVAIDTAAALAVVTNEEDNSVTLLGFGATDTVPPTITAAVAPAANAAGWHNTDVTVTFTCSDAGSGVASCPTPVTVTTEGAGQQVTGTATDNAGNTASATVTLNIDKTPPGVLAPLDLVVEATADLTPVSLGTAVANDAIAGPLPVSADQSGPFALGTHLVTWTVVDPAGNNGSAVQTVVVQDTTAPAITVPADVSVTVNSVPATVTLGSATATDLFGPVTVSNDAPAAFPEGATPVTWTATDTNGNSVTAVQTVTVVLNRPPAIVSTPVTAVTAGSLYSYGVSAVDPDPADVLTYSLSLAPAGMVIDATNGLIQWTPTDTQAGDYPVTVVATDGGGLSASQSFVISVAPRSLAPSITSTPATSATAGMPYSYAITASDPNNDPLTYALTTAPAGMTIDAATGQVTWTPTLADVGSHSVSVLVTDGVDGADTQGYTLTVAAPPNTPPTLTTTPPTTVTAAQAYVYDADAVDPDSFDRLEFSLAAGPAGMHIDAATGVVSWTPAENLAGSFPVTVVVRDAAGASDSQSFTVMVAAVALAPQITSSPMTTAAVGGAYSYTVQGVDPNPADTLSYRLVQGPAGMAIDPVGGVLSWMPDARYAASPEAAGGACTLNVPDSAVFRPLTKWIVQDSAIGPPVVGPLVDTADSTSAFGKADNNRIINWQGNASIVRRQHGSILWFSILFHDPIADRKWLPASGEC